MAEISELHFTTQPGGMVQGSVRVPGDKSISHRSIMLGSLASGTTTVDGFLEGEDSLATLAAFRAMGVDISDPNDGQLSISGVGIDGLVVPASPLDLGNSGTAMRLMAGVLAGQSFASTLSGDESLNSRPMQRVCAPLASMGARIHAQPTGTPPLRIEPSTGLTGIDYQMPVASAQVKSCLLLAGLYASGETCVSEPAVTRDHTERMLESFGARVYRSQSRVCVEGGQQLGAIHVSVPGDFSSATFFLVSAAICPGSDLLIENVGINPTRIGALEVLRLMGADIELQNRRQSGAEPVADLRVRYRPLQGIDVPEALVPLAIDEFPVLLIAALAADGPTRVTGAEELRVKESDRIDAMANGLRAVGIDVSETADGITVYPGPLTGGIVDSRGDHRIAMAFAIAGLLCESELTVGNCANVNTSFPGFIDVAQEAGLALVSAND